MLADGSVELSARAIFQPPDLDGVTRSTLETVDIDATIDWDGTPFSFALFTWEFVQHEAIHHGQWSIYASLAGFDTPVSWRASWGL
jgi:hypothetical protein